MYTDNDLGKSGLDGVADSEEENQDKSLEWLLDMDLDEPEEKLFTVSGGEYHDEGLSAFEAEVAGRPLQRGNAGSDDLSSYVDEEIVITSASAERDIYSEADEARNDESAEKSERGIMAIDFSLEQAGSGGAGASCVEEGADILGLTSDDDMGEKFLAIKRVKSSDVDHSEDKREETPLGVDREMSDVTTKEADAGVGPADVDLSPAMNLTEAPVPTQVVDPSIDVVANEVSHLEGADTVGAVEESSLSEPLDFDFAQFPLSGDDRPEAANTEEGLTVERMEGLVSADPFTDFDIEYHEDFQEMAGQDQGSLPEIAAIISPVMEELAGRARVRAEELGLGADAVAADVMLGTDEQSIARCHAEGYQPVAMIFAELPGPLLELDQAGRESVFVRLLSIETKQNWNNLFSAEFVVPELGHDKSAGAGTLAEQAKRLTNTVEVLSDVEQEVELDNGLGEDLFGDDIFDDFSTDFSTDFGVAFAAEDDAVEPGIENSFSGFEVPDEIGADVSAISETAGSDIEDAFSGLEASDDIAEDFSAEFSAKDETADADIESAFSVLESSGDSNDEIDSLKTQAFEQDGEFDSIELHNDIDARMCIKSEESEPVELQQDDVGSEDAALLEVTGTAWCIPESIKFNYTTQSNAEIFADFLDAFIEEGTAEIEKLENIIGEWERDITAEALFADVSRTLHTIKGIAKGVGLQRLGTLVHNFETLLERLPRPDEDGEQMYFRIVNAWLDAVVRGVEFVTEHRVDIASELPVIAGGSSVQVAEDDAAEDAVEADRPAQDNAENILGERKTTILSALEKKRDQKLADEGAKALAAQQSVRITSEKLDHMLNLASQAQQLGVRASQNTTRSKRSSSELQGRLSSVRATIGKIADRALLNVTSRGGSSTADMDALEMDQYSELQEAANILREGVEDLADLVDVVGRQNVQIEALLKQQSSVISSISSSIQGARVVPVSRLMPGLRRIVRTVSTDLDKTVNFKVLNETGALDRDHYARLQTVMEHMVRNALDHGIESPEDRLAAGKPTGGRITVDVKKSGGDYIIRLSDDGRGIDADAIRESAYNKGLDIDVDELSDEEVLRLIFHKGFSTANTLSEISGRGVGMDIVLTELQQIGGDIQIKSSVGFGTTFEVRIPSNVSVNGALLVTAADESYAIPLNGLFAVEQVPVDEFFTAAECGKTLQLFDSECVPAYLGTLCQGVGLPDRKLWSAFVPVIIAGSEDRRMAIAIDNVEEALELVVRSLGSQFSTVPGLAGAATTADGEAIVALDLNLLVTSMGADGIAPVAVDESEETGMLALVVDDSRTQRMVATSQLEKVGVETVTAENGLVAIDLLNATHRLPDVVLLDVEMPVKDGIETLREIRKSQRYGHIPVIMVTSRTGAKHRALAKNAGCNAYMGKPFNFPALLEQINDLTGCELQLS